MRTLVRLPFAWVLAALLTVTASGCGQEPIKRLAPAWESGELVVLILESPTTYYIDSDGAPAGFEYDLARQFAERNGWKLRLEVARDVEELVDRIARGEAHVAAAGLAVTPERSTLLRFGPIYMHQREVVVCGSTRARPRRIEDLARLRLEVVAGSSHAERLQELRLAYPGLKWIELPRPSTEDLFERAAAGLTDCLVADVAAYDVARNYQPNLTVAFDLSDDRDIGWAMPKLAELELRQAAQDFFRALTESGQLAALKERYFGHLHRLDEADVVAILEKRIRLLPRLKKHFLEAQQRTAIDWRLLAALAYQESKWDPQAVSPTGVRGIMMLTAETADRLGVADRLDPRQSIVGGARYLALLREGMPESIPEPDRTWMALAAYNIGEGHLADARRLAQVLGKDPDAWRDVKEVLPQLSRETYGRHLRYGYARGGEARFLTENVRIYYDILARFEESHAVEPTTMRRSGMARPPARLAVAPPRSNALGGVEGAGGR